MEIFIRKKTLACPWKHCHILTLSHESNLKENIGKILTCMQVVTDFLMPLFSTVTFPEIWWSLGYTLRVFFFFKLWLWIDYTISYPVNSLPLNLDSEKTRYRGCSDLPSMNDEEDSRAVFGICGCEITLDPQEHHPQSTGSLGCKIDLACSPRCI